MNADPSERRDAARVCPACGGFVADDERIFQIHGWLPFVMIILLPAIAGATLGFLMCATWFGGPR